MIGLRSCHGKIWEFLKKIVSDFVKWAGDMINTVKEEVPKIIDKIGEFFSNLPDKLKEIGKNAIEGLVNGIKEKWEALKGTVSNIANGIKDGFQNTLQIHSPSKVMADLVGKNIMLGIEQGFVETAGNSMRNMQNALLDGVETVNIGKASGGNVLNVYTQELDSAKLEQILEYVDKKFGIKFGAVY